MNHVVLERLSKVGVIAVLRAPSSESAVRAAETLVSEGITGIEVTYSTPDAAAAITRIRANHGDAVYLGAGTVLTKAHAREAVDAGAEFLVSPGIDADVATTMVGLGVPAMLGALTPTEVMRASALGATVVKVFPASLGGPSYLAALRAPFPDVPLMPTGGVNAANLVDWFRAGAVAVGAGGDLVPKALLTAGDWTGIAAIARSFRQSFDRVAGDAA